MRAAKLQAGKKYFCVWASRVAEFVKLETHTWCGKPETYAVFKDICDVVIECRLGNVERFVKEM